MSRPWNRSLQLQVDAQSVRGTLRAAWLQRKGLVLLSPSGEAPTTIQAIVAESRLTEPLSQAIDAVLNDLDRRASTHKACLTVTLTDARVHFDVVTGDYGAYSDRQLQAIAVACVTELLGGVAPSQVVRWQLQPDLRHLLICAMDQKDIEAVVQAAELHGLQLSSLQPEFCREWNQHAAALSNGSGVFAVVSAEHMLVAWAVRGAITALSCGPWVQHGPATASQLPGKNALDTQVDRLLASVGQAAEDVTRFVLVARAPAMLEPSARWTVLSGQKEAA